MRNASSGQTRTHSAGDAVARADELRQCADEPRHRVGQATTQSPQPEQRAGFSSGSSIIESRSLQSQGSNLHLRTPRLVGNRVGPRRPFRGGCLSRRLRRRPREPTDRAQTRHDCHQHHYPVMDQATISGTVMSCHGGVFSKATMVPTTVSNTSTRGTSTPMRPAAQAALAYALARSISASRGGWPSSRASSAPDGWRRSPPSS